MANVAYRCETTSALPGMVAYGGYLMVYLMVFDGTSGHSSARWGIAGHCRGTTGYFRKVDGTETCKVDSETSIASAPPPTPPRRVAPHSGTASGHLRRTQP